MLIILTNQMAKKIIYAIDVKKVMMKCIEVSGPMSAQTVFLGKSLIIKLYELKHNSLPYQLKILSMKNYKRNYRREYIKYYGKTKATANPLQKLHRLHNAARHKARRVFCKINGISKDQLKLIGGDIDHRNKNPLDNRPSNLRIMDIKKNRGFCARNKCS